MTLIHIDTALLAVPNYAIDAETGQEIIDRIIHFSEVSDPSLPLRLVVSSDADALLWGQNFGPDYDQIDAFLDLMDLKHIYSANDLLQRYQILFQHCSRACDVDILEARDVAMLHSEPQLPDVSPTQMISETKRVFATAASSNYLGRQLRVGSAFYGAPASSYEVKVILNDFQGGNADVLGPPPVELSSTVVTITHIRDLISTEIADEIWRGAETAADIHFAITLGALALQLQAGENPSCARLAKFGIGSEFVQSLAAVECWGNARFSGAIRVLCSQIVAGKCNRQINPFSLRGQYVRPSDGARAWRTHLTNSGLGLRLMHWSSDRGLEFANVDVKDGEYIEYGSGELAAALDLREQIG